MLVNLSALRAATPAVTQQGTIVGTFQYMAPEVLQGNESDVRSGIFGFGCTLYEMVTGRKAFEGKSQLSVILVHSIRESTAPVILVVIWDSTIGK
ncbi:MAG TPA: protein kinase [Terriglobales bacterium]|nr:protein kinase [Terriglobales bacterium]